MIVLKLKKKYTGPDNIIEHFNCLKRNILARCIYLQYPFGIVIVQIAYRHTCTVDASYLLFKLLRSD